MARTAKKTERELCAEVAAACACFQFRKASRAVTQMFDETLAPSGLRSTQMIILVVLTSAGTASVARLAKELVMDPSTLTRTLKTMERNGLIAKSFARDGRRVTVALTDQGREAVIEAFPLWRDAQQRLISRLGEDHWGELMGKLSDTVLAAKT